MACFHIQRLLPEAGARRASHNCSAAIGDGGEKSRSDLRDGVRCAWAKPSLDAMTTSSALIGSGSPETFPAERRELARLGHGFLGGGHSFKRVPAVVYVALQWFFRSTRRSTSVANFFVALTVFKRIGNNGSPTSLDHI